MMEYPQIMAFGENQNPNPYIRDMMYRFRIKASARSSWVQSAQTYPTPKLAEDAGRRFLKALAKGIE